LFLAVPLPYLTASAQAPEIASSGAVLTVASANVSVGNSNPGPLVEWLSREHVDVVAVFEVSPEYSERMGAELQFPFRKVIPSHSPFGIALLSRYPLEDLEVIYDPDGIAHIEAKMGWQGETLTIIALHPMPPLEPHYQVIRNSKLRSLAKAAVDEGYPAIFAGDINATPWSSAFSGLDNQGLRRATGLAPSWPTGLGGFVGIPIDHVLVTGHWGVVQSNIGPELGSDHFPVMARLRLKSAVTGY
jgi:endonuclease/exonuclease/phosphatase (EEP) superfamily protein YafD